MNNNKKEMKKFIFGLMLMLASVVSVSAQVVYEKSKLLDNVYVGGQVGVMTPIDFENVFPLNTQVSARIGKDWSPILGTFIEVIGFLNDRGLYPSNTIVKGINTALGSTVNLTNLICDYKGSPRTFEVGTVATLGWYHCLNAGRVNVVHCDDLSAKTGIDLMFNVGEQKAWQFYIEPSVFWDLTKTKGGTVQFTESYAQVGIAAGVNYKFMTSNGTHNFKVWNIGELNDEINKLRAENESLKNLKPTIVEKVVKEFKVEQKEVFVEKTTVVTFGQNSYKLSDEAMASLDKITAKNVSVVAYASPEGGADYNKNLSLKRANIVADYLAHKNINVTKIEGKGAVNSESNRIAIVIAE